MDIFILAIGDSVALTVQGKSNLDIPWTVPRKPSKDVTSHRGFPRLEMHLILSHVCPTCQVIHHNSQTREHTDGCHQSPRVTQGTNFHFSLLEI